MRARTGCEESVIGKIGGLRRLCSATSGLGPEGEVPRCPLIEANQIYRVSQRVSAIKDDRVFGHAGAIA